ncbi:FAD binding domain-containing protein [Streptomyces sp. NPDC005388]|uniref:FAD binding domain-containing protein n=1 Tax=Streptomyces sp. NPDC005388 TaxID=3156717 RepID=UPI0033AEB559
MLLRLPTSVSEAQECMAEGAVPIGGATLIWATWQRDGFPEQAMSLRDLPEANTIGRETLGGAVILNRIDDRVPEALRRAAATVGTGAVRRTATVGGNIVGSTLRCLLPAALVLEARAVVLDPDSVYETDLTEVLAKGHLLLGLRWRDPITSAYRKLPGETGGPPPLVVAAALHTADTGGTRLRVAVRDGYDVITESTEYDADSDSAQVLDDLRCTAVGALHATAWEAVHELVTDLLSRPSGR